MGDILPFRKKPGRRLGLCQHGHHRWVVDKTGVFDVKKGRLVTRYKCQRCGRQKVEAR